MPNYTGVCINRLGESVISSVRVRFPDKSERDVDAATYIRQRASPSLPSLPDCCAVKHES
jgi:hypothetical protein